MKQTEQQSSGRNQDNSNQRLSGENFVSTMELSGSQKLQTYLKVLQSIQIMSPVILINGRFLNCLRQGYIRAFVEATLLEGGAGAMRVQSKSEIPFNFRNL